MINDKDAAALRQYIERFTKLGEEDWNLLLPHPQERKLSKNQLFAHQGIIVKEIGFMLEGSMRHFYLKEGEEKPLTFILSIILYHLTSAALPIHLHSFPLRH